MRLWDTILDDLTIVVAAALGLLASYMIFFAPKPLTVLAAPVAHTVIWNDGNVYLQPGVMYELLPDGGLLQVPVQPLFAVPIVPGVYVVQYDSVKGAYFGRLRMFFFEAVR
jgi:hypothetical protein